MLITSCPLPVRCVHFVLERTLLVFCSKKKEAHKKRGTHRGAMKVWGTQGDTGGIANDRPIDCLQKHGGIGGTARIPRRTDVTHKHSITLSSSGARPAHKRHRGHVDSEMGRTNGGIPGPTQRPPRRTHRHSGHKRLATALDPKGDTWIESSGGADVKEVYPRPVDGRDIRAQSEAEIIASDTQARRLNPSILSARLLFVMTSLTLYVSC